VTKAEGKFDVSNTTHGAVNTKVTPKNIPKVHVFLLLKMTLRVTVCKVHDGALEAEYNNGFNA
jgi:hypothetical protein